MKTENFDYQICNTYSDVLIFCLFLRTCHISHIHYIVQLDRRERRILKTRLGSKNCMYFMTTTSWLLQQKCVNSVCYRRVFRSWEKTLGKNSWADSILKGIVVRFVLTWLFAEKKSIVHFPYCLLMVEQTDEKSLENINHKLSGMNLSLKFHARYPIY